MHCYLERMVITHHALLPAAGFGVSALGHALKQQPGVYSHNRKLLLNFASDKFFMCQYMPTKHYAYGVCECQPLTANGPLQTSSNLIAHQLTPTG